MNGPFRRLPCGAELDDLVERVAEGLPPRSEHERTCPDCRRARAELEELWDGVRALARQEVVPPQRLVASVMRRVREGLIAPHSSLPLDEVVPRLVRHAFLPGERGTTRIADAVVARVVAAALDEVAGVELAGGRRCGRALRVDVAESRVSIVLRLALPYGSSLPALADMVREHVVGRTEELTGLAVDALDVAVDDLLEPAPRNFSGRRGSNIV